MKAVYEENQCIIGGKLFSSYMTLIELAQGLWDSKTSDLNYSYKTLVQKEALTISQDKAFASFFVFYNYHQF